MGKTEPLLSRNKIYEFSADGIKYFTYFDTTYWAIKAYLNGSDEAIESKPGKISEACLEENFFGTGVWRIIDSWQIPKGYTFTGEFRKPIPGESYFLTTPRDGGEPRVSVARHATSSWFILEPDITNIPGPRYIPEGYYWTGELRKTRPGDIYITATGSDPQPRKGAQAFIHPKPGQPCSDRHITPVGIRYILRPLEEYEKIKDLVNVTKEETFKTLTTFLEDRKMATPITSTDTTEMIFTEDTNGNVKFLMGYVEKNITKDKAVALLGELRDSKEKLVSSPGVGTAYIDDQIKAIEVNETALIAILNDKKRK